MRSGGLRRLRARIEAPRFAIASTLTVAAGVLVAYIVPQSWTGATPTGLWANPRVAAIVSALWLDRVYSSPWFLVVLAVFLLAMSSSAARQWTQARKRLRAGLPGPWVHVGNVADEAAFASFASSRGYRMRPDALRAVRHAYGHYAATLLHAGIIAAVLFSVLVTVTQQRLTVSLAAGETWSLGQPVAEEAHGPLARALSPDAPVRLDAFSARYWSSGGVRSLASTVTLGEGDSFPISVKRSAVRGGMRFYQSQTYGDAFFVEVARSGEATESLRLELGAPRTPDVASYADFAFGSDTRVLRVKYYPDVSRAKMTGTPEITLRLEDAGVVVDQVTLTEGESAPFDGGTIHLVAVRPWTDVIMVADHGIPLLFISFAVLLAGALLVYLAPVRELRAVEVDGGLEVQWAAVRGHGIDDSEVADLRESLIGTER